MGVGEGEREKRPPPPGTSRRGRRPRELVRLDTPSPRLPPRDRVPEADPRITRTRLLVDAHARRPAGGGSVGAVAVAVVIVVAVAVGAAGACRGGGGGGGGLVHVDLVGERVRVARRDGRDVVLVCVHAGHELHHRRGERLLHRVTDLCALCIKSWRYTGQHGINERRCLRVGLS